MNVTAQILRLLDTTIRLMQLLIRFKRFSTDIFYKKMDPAAERFSNKLVWV